FSSRRRHTRFSRDWSSDVCSSDLAALAGLWQAVRAGGPARQVDARRALACALALLLVAAGWPLHGIAWSRPTGAPLQVRLVQGKIGRAACREGGEEWEGAVSVRKT